MYKNNQLKISVHTSNQTLFMQDKFNSTNTGKLNPACSLVPAQKDLILSCELKKLNDRDIIIGIPYCL